MFKPGIVAAATGFLLISNVSFAAEPHPPMDHSGHEATYVQVEANSDDMKSMTPEEHQNMTTDQHQNMNMDEHQNMNMDMKMNMSHDGGLQGGGHSHGGNVNVVETPPNVQVLGTFGVINLVFILYGAWNKWLRRKGSMA